jgi:hypothetical protein
MLALEENQALLSLNLEGNRISPDSLASLFESLATCKNGLIEVRVTGQAQEKMGHRYGPGPGSGATNVNVWLSSMCRVESRIADAVLKNPRLIKLGIKFEFKEVMNR